MRLRTYLKNYFLGFLLAVLVAFLASCSTQSSYGLLSLQYISSSNKLCSKNIDPILSHDLLSLFAIAKGEKEAKMGDRIYSELSCDDKKLRRFILLSKYLYSIGDELKLKTSLKNKLVLNFLQKICLGQIDLNDKGNWFLVKIQEKKTELNENDFKMIKDLKELSCKNKVYTKVTGILKQYKEF